MKYSLVPTVFSVSGMTIREYQTTDVESLRRAANVPDIAVMTASMPYPYRRRDAVTWIQLCRRRYRQRPVNERHYVITCGQEVIGAVSASRHGDEAEIGYWLTPAYWGQGRMTKVVRKFVPFVFSWWPVVRVIGRTLLNNPASGRVLEKSGFYRTANEIHAVRKGQKWLDLLVYAKYRR